MPQVAVGALMGGLQITGSLAAGFSIGFSVSGAIMGGAMALVSGLLAETPSRAAAFTSEATDRNVIVRSPISPHRAIYGRARVSGTLVFAEVTESGDDKYLHLVIVLAGREISNIGEVYFNDEAVSSARFSGYVRINRHLGSPDQLADADLVAESTLWTVNHRLRGRPYIYVRLKKSYDVFPTGIPNIKVDTEGHKVYDPRTSLTAYSENPALCIRDYLTWQYGVGSPESEINDTKLIADANICDEDVVIDAQSNVQPRYTCNGSFTLDRAPLDILHELKTSMAGAVVWSMGQWETHAGAAVLASGDITEDDIRGTVSYRPRPGRDQLFNAVRGTYVNPADYWQPTDFPPIINSLYESQDGERIYKDVTLSFTIDGIEAQRNAKIELENHRQSITVNMPLMLSAGLKFKVWQVVRVTLSPLGWVNKLFRIIDWKLVPAGRGLGVDVVLQEYSDANYDWVYGEATTIDTAPNTILPTPHLVEAPTNLTLATGDAVALIQGDGTVVPRIKATWTKSTDTFLIGHEIRWKATTDSVWLSRLLGVDAEEEYLSPILDGADYDVELRAINKYSGTSPWVPANTITGAGKTLAPTAPSAATVTPKTAALFLEWSNADDLYTEIWVSATNDRNTATRAGRILSNTLLHPTPAGETRYTWYRSVDTSENFSTWYPTSATAGISGTAKYITSEDLISYLRQASATSFRNGFEDYEFSDWTDYLTNTVVQNVDSHSGTWSGLFTQHDVVGTTWCGSVLISDEIAQSFIGQRVRVSVYARQPATNPSATFKLMVRTPVGNSGWNEFTPNVSWTNHGFDFDVPESWAGNTMQVVVQADPTGSGKSVLIDGVNVQLNPSVFIEAGNIDQYIGVAAISQAYLGLAAVGEANIQDLAVDTLKLKDQAVTIPVSAHTGASTSTTGSSWLTLQSATIVSTGAPIYLWFSFVSLQYSSNWPQMRILRNGGEIYQSYLRGYNLSSLDERDMISGSLKDQPGSGTYTYTVQIQRAFGGVKAAKRSLMLIETKK